MAPTPSHRIIRRYVLPWALVLVGIAALGAHKYDFMRMDEWAWVALIAFAVAPMLGLRSWPGLRLLLISIPFWIFGNAYEPFTLVAVGLVIAAMVVAVLLPILPSRRVNDASRVPFEHLASGPLVPVTPQVCYGGQRSKALTYMTVGLLVVAGILFILLALGKGEAELIGLIIASLIISGTFAFGNWFADRVRLRVDEVGVHGRTMFFEHTAKWSDITGLRLRYLFMLGLNVRVVYYVVESRRREVAFPSSMRGADELRATIEAATGLKWAEPEITANM